MTREVTDQLYIELDYFTPEEYFVYVAEAESAQSATASLSCDITVTAAPIQASASLVSSSSLTLITETQTYFKGTYWEGSDGGTYDKFYQTSMVTLGNYVYTSAIGIMSTGGTDYDGIFVTKRLKATGLIEWTKKIPFSWSTGQGIRGTVIKTDGTDLWVSHSVNTSGANWQGWIYRISTDGVAVNRLWTYNLGGYIEDFVIDGTNLYVLNTDSSVTNDNQIVIGCYNKTTFARVWSKVWNTNDGNRYGGRLAIDASDLIVTAFDQGSSIGYISRFNLAGTHQWSRTFSGPIDRPKTVIDSSGNIIIAGSIASNNYVFSQTKTNTVNWARNNATTISDLALDSNDNIYTGRMAIDNTGGLIWSREFSDTYSPGVFSLYSVEVDSDLRVWMSGTSPITADLILNFESSEPPELNNYSFLDISNTSITESDYTWSFYDPNQALNTYTQTTTSLTNPWTTATPDLQSVSFPALTNVTTYDYTYVRLKTGSAQLASDLAVSATIKRQRPGQSVENSTTTLTAALTRAAQLASAVSATTTLTAITKITALGQVTLASDASLTATASRTRNEDISLASQTSLQVEGERLRPYSSDLASDAALTANLQLQAQAEATLQAFAVTLTVAVKVGDFTADLHPTSSLAAEVNITAQAEATLQATAMLETALDLAAQAEAQLATTSAMLVSAQGLVRATSSLSSSSALACDFLVIVTGTSTQTSTATMTCTGQRQALLTTQAHSDTALTAQAQSQRALAAELDTSATLLGSLRYIVRFSSTMQAFAVQLTVGDILHLDELRTWRIPQETRLLIIDPETRVQMIDQETRNYKIKGYTNVNS